MYINTNIKLKNGGRKAVKISLEKLKELIYKKYIKIDSNNPENYSFEDFKKHPWYCIDEDNQVSKDLFSKIIFNTENLTFDTPFSHKIEDNHLVGFHQLENGLAFLGGMGGGDWEWPLFFIIYYDGKKLRGYIPLCGNTVNIDYKCAFGSEGEFLHENEIDGEKIEKEYKKILLVANNKLSEPLKEKDLREIDPISVPYMLKYGNFSFEDIMYKSYEEFEINWDLIKKDIKSRIIL